MPPNIRIPKDIFYRLQQDTQPWPRQGILFGVKEDCIDLGPVVYVKGFVPYRSDAQDLDTTVSQWMNHNDMTVVGFFAAPSADLFDDCQLEEIASCYFETLQASIIRSVASTISYQSAYSAAPVDSSAALVPLCHRLFQSLIGLVISTHRPLSSSQGGYGPTPSIAHLLPPIIPGAVIVTAFVCAPSRRDICSIVRDELKDGRGDIKPCESGEPLNEEQVNVNMDVDDDVKMTDENSTLKHASTLHSSQDAFSTEDSAEDESDIYTTVSHRVMSKVGYTSLSAPFDQQQHLRPLPFQHYYEIIPGNVSEYLYSAMGSSGLSMSTTQDSLHLIDDTLYTEEEIEATRRRISRIQKAIDSSIKDMTTRIDQVYAPACSETDQLISILKVLDGREVGEWARIVIVAMDNDVQAQHDGLQNHEVKIGNSPHREEIDLNQPHTSSITQELTDQASSIVERVDEVMETKGAVADTSRGR